MSVSEKYLNAINTAEGLFDQYLQNIPTVEITAARYRIGCDSIVDEDIVAAIKKVYIEMLDVYQYELSYSQLNNAFFGNLLKNKKLRLI